MRALPGASNRSAGRGRRLPGPSWQASPVRLAPIVGWTPPRRTLEGRRVELIYPDSTVIVVNRDGRDVAASFVHRHSALTTFSKPWPSGSSAWGACAATQRSRPDRILSIDLVDLVRTTRSGDRADLCVRRSDGGSRHVRLVRHERDARSSHAGQWRRDFDADTCAQIDGPISPRAGSGECRVQLPSGGSARRSRHDHRDRLHRGGSRTRGLSSCVSRTIRVLHSGMGNSSVGGAAVSAEVFPGMGAR